MITSWMGKTAHLKKPAGVASLGMAAHDAHRESRQHVRVFCGARMLGAANPRLELVSVQFREKICQRAGRDRTQAIPP